MDETSKKQFASRIAGGNSATSRKQGDFYPTPPEVTIALLNFLNIPTKSTIWECACGRGDMSKIIENAGYCTISSDLNNGGYGQAGIDFTLFDAQQNSLPFDWIITNPPFSLAEQFIFKAWELGKPFAFLLKSQFWNAARRVTLFENCPPSYILPLTWRPDFTGAGGALMDMNWNVWERNPKQSTQFYILKKPIIKREVITL